MKKIFLTLLALFFLTRVSFGQWTTSGTDIYTTITGNVGIGTTSPQTKLHVVGGEIRLAGAGPSGFASGAYITFYDSNNTTRYGWIGDGSSANTDIYLSADIGALHFAANGADRMFIGTTGNVGIGTITPLTALSVVVPSPKGTVAGNVVSFLSTNDVSNPFGLRTMIYGAASIDSRYVTLQTTDYSLVDGGTLVLQPTVGSLGVGTTDSKGYKFAVNGSAIATSMTVKLNANWPDYVFKTDYHLASLQEVKSYIDQNHHLPEMPTAAEVEKDGLNLGEANKLLTKKVEELTLYLIEKDKKEKEQELINQNLKDRLDKLEQVINEK